MPAQPCRPQPGFTLVELLAAVAVLGVLVAIALPAYREQSARARRSQMQAVLIEDAGYMQRYYAANNAYAASPPPRLTYAASPRAGAPDYLVTVSVPAADPTSFVLTATRAGAMRDDRCGDFTYDNLGQRDLVPGSFAAGLSAEACWR
ncbi:MAG: type IV pilin protein [Burkholderiaceae bacterium]